MASLPIAPTRIRKQSHITNRQTWTPEEDALLFKLANEFPISSISWSLIAKNFPNKTPSQLAGRWSKVLDPDLIKGSWTREEDEIIMQYVQEKGQVHWSKLALKLKGRTGKQCRERFKDHLDPNVTHSPWTQEEDDQLIQLHETYGNQWTKLVSFFEGRSENQIKNRWNSTLKKRIERIQLGLPPVLKRGRKPKDLIPQPDFLENSNNNSGNSSVCSSPSFGFIGVNNLIEKLPGQVRSPPLAHDYSNPHVNRLALLKLLDETQ